MSYWDIKNILSQTQIPPHLVLSKVSFILFYISHVSHYFSVVAWFKYLLPMNDKLRIFLSARPTLQEMQEYFLGGGIMAFPLHAIGVIVEW